MRMRSSLLATMIPTAVLLASIAPRAAHAQRAGESPSNFDVPRGVATVAPGTLGHVEKRGDGPVTLILLPGLGFGWRAWDGFMQRNADRYTMYAVTPAGYDGTPPPVAPAMREAFEQHDWTDGMIDGLVGLIESEGLRRPIVVGHHLLGDHFALRMGLEHPDLVGGVVVVSGDPSRPVSPNLDGDPAPSVEDQRLFVTQNMVPKYRRRADDGHRDMHAPAAALSRDEARAERLFDAQAANPAYVDYRYFLEYLTTNLALELPRLEPRLMVVEPLRDVDETIERLAERFRNEETDLETARRLVEERLIQQHGSLERARRMIGGDPDWERLRSRIRNLRLEYVPDTGIFIMDDQPEAFDELMAAFVREVTAD